jgi:hypothetical protein
VALDQAHQPSFVLVGHDRAERIADRRHREDGLDPAGFQGRLQGVEVHAGARMHGNLQRLDAHLFDQLHHAEVGWTLDGDRLTRSDHGAQRDVQRLHGADGSDEVVFAQRQAGQHRAPRQLPTQRG